MTRIDRFLALSFGLIVWHAMDVFGIILPGEKDYLEYPCIDYIFRRHRGGYLGDMFFFPEADEMYIGESITVEVTPPNPLYIFKWVMVLPHGMLFSDDTTTFVPDIPNVSVEYFNIVVLDGLRFYCDSQRMYSLPIPNFMLESPDDVRVWDDLEGDVHSAIIPCVLMPRPMHDKLTFVYMVYKRTNSGNLEVYKWINDTINIITRIDTRWSQPFLEDLDRRYYINLDNVSSDDAGHYCCTLQLMHPYGPYNRTESCTELIYVYPCQNSPCLNGGTCAYSSNSSIETCVCPADYFGTICENECTDCLPATQLFEITVALGAIHFIPMIQLGANCVVSNWEQVKSGSVSTNGSVALVTDDYGGDYIVTATNAWKPEEDTCRVTKKFTINITCDACDETTMSSSTTTSSSTSTSSFTTKSSSTTTSSFTTKSSFTTEVSRTHDSSGNKTANNNDKNAIVEYVLLGGGVATVTGLVSSITMLVIKIRRQSKVFGGHI